MSVKNMRPLTSETRGFLFCLVSLSIFLLFVSCFTLLRSSSSSPLPDSVLLLMLANSTSVVSTRSAGSSIHHLHSLPRPAILNKTRPPSTRYGVRRNSSSDEDTRISEHRDRKPCDSNKALLKVFMYELPPEFHFGLLGWRGERDQIWPDVGNVYRVPRYPGGLNLQHSVEYWLTLDLLSSNVPGIARPCTAVRVKDSSQADVVFVPFFSSLSYNRHSKLHRREKVSRNKFLQGELVRFLMDREEWKRWGGKDHLIVAHHPNSMLEARMSLGSAMFLLADFGRYPVEIANIKKDVIAPYRHVVKSVGDDSAPFEGRPILVYFRGAIYRKDGGIIRQELYRLLKDEKDVHFAYGSAQGNGIRHAARGIASSKFCLNIAGDTPSSNRLFDAIVSHCVPVVITDDIELPFEDVLDYSGFCIFVRASDAVKKGFLLNLLRGIGRDEWTTMRERLKQIAHHFEYQYPSERGDAVQMIWEAVARRVPSIRLKLHKEDRFHRSQLLRNGSGMKVQSRTSI